MRRFRQSLLATAFFIGVAAPLSAWAAEPPAQAAVAEQVAPAAPAAQSTQRTSGSVTGTISAPSANEFTLNYNGGSVKVLTSGVAAAEKTALTEGARVTVTGTLDQTQRAVIAQKVAAADPNTPTSGAAKTAASADAATPSAPTADTAAAAPADGEQSAMAEAESTTDAEVAANEAPSATEDGEVATAENDAAPAPEEAAPSTAVAANAPATAAPATAPRQQMAAADAERLNLAPDANLPQEVVAEISDGNYTTADLNRAALAAMRAAPSAAG